MQGTQVRALFREDPTCHVTTKPVHHNYWACDLEPVSHNYRPFVPQLLKPAHRNYWSLYATTTEACEPRARGLQQEKPAQCNEE